MALQILGGCKLGFTGMASIWPVPSVNTHVLFKVAGLCEPPVTLVAAVRLDAQVALSVDVQTGLGRKLAPAALTLVQLQLEMSSDVLPHVAGCRELGRAEGASIRPFTCVRSYVKFE